MKITLTVALLAFLSTGCFGQSTRLEDHSDWWSLLNEDAPEMNVKSGKAGLSTRNFTIAGVSLEKDDPKQVESKLGRVKSVERGDASTGREQLCYASSKGSENLYLIFEYGEVDATFYLFAGGRSWTGREYCASTAKVSKALSTPSGLKLGLTRKQVEAILGKPDFAADGRIVYSRETERKTTVDEFQELRRDYPEQLSDQAAHEKFDLYTVETYIEARFGNTGLNYLVVSTSTTD